MMSSTVEINIRVFILLILLQQLSTITTETTILVNNEKLFNNNNNNKMSGTEIIDTTKQSTICQIDRVTDDGNGKSYFIIDGDFYVTFMMTSKAGIIAEFIVSRINNMGLIGFNGTLGLRMIEIDDFSEVIETYLKEIQFHQECLPDSLGIFVTPKIWETIEPMATNTTWQLDAIDTILLPKLAHFLYDLPWINSNLSAEIRTQSTEYTNKFINYAKREHLCLKTQPNVESIFLLIGNEALRETRFTGNESIFAVPLGDENFDTSFVKDLPEKSYIFTETKIDLNDLNDTMDIIITESQLKNSQILSSEFIIITSVLLDMTNWLNNSIYLYCNDEDVNNMTCTNPLKDLYKWKSFREKQNSMEMLKEIDLEFLENSMKYNLVQSGHIKLNETVKLIELKHVGELNLITNITTFFHYTNDNLTTTPLINKTTKLGHLFMCSNDDDDDNKTENHVNNNDLTLNSHDGIDEVYYEKMYWRLKSDAWIAIGLTISVLGILISLAILIFIVVRICMDDVLEGNPVSTILLLISLIIMFGSFLPFSLEYTGTDKSFVDADSDTMNKWTSLCAIQLFLVTLCYCITFSLLLCRAIMLASIGSEGGFLSHVNGYIQSVICIFSILVQIGLSTQLLIILHATHKSVSCHNIFYGNWFWAIIAYDGCLLLTLIISSPLYFRSQRNYKEGIFILIGALLTAAVWSVWIPVSLLDHRLRLIAVPLGLQFTAVVILCGILIPRIFLIVRGIARSDLAQTLPSLTTLAFAQANNQFQSEQSIYECVNPAMRQRNNNLDNDDEINENEIPTLPLRGSSRSNNQNYIYYSQQDDHHQSSYYNHDHDHYNHSSTLPLSPSKMTRF